MISPSSEVLGAYILVTALPRVNRKYQPVRAGKNVRQMRTNEWRKKIEDMILLLKHQKKRETITEKCDAVIILRLHGNTDSDACIKGIFDALEESEIIKDDNLIGDFTVLRSNKKKKDPDSAVIFLIQKGTLLISLHKLKEASNAAEYSGQSIKRG